MSDLLTLLRKHPKVLKVLRKHGVHFCAGCYLTLSATPEKAAAFHGVPDVELFLKDIRGAVSAPTRRRHVPRRHRTDR